MQTLMDGGEISKKVRTDMNYEDLKKHRSDDFWSMLAYAGYLTVAGKSTFDVDNGPLPFKIPNLSIKKFFGNRIQEYFSDEIFSSNKGTTLTQAIFEGDAPKVKAVLREILQRYISVRDISAKIPKEYYYHALLNGYFSSQEDLIAQYSSNAEAGDGYTDIRFESMDGLKAVIIELKYTDDPKLMSSLATKAIEQIEDKNYKDAYIGDDYTQILAYGICFSKKNCAVALKKLNNTES